MRKNKGNHNRVGGFILFKTLAVRVLSDQLLKNV